MNQTRRQFLGSVAAFTLAPVVPVVANLPDEEIVPLYPPVTYEVIKDSFKIASVAELPTTHDILNRHPAMVGFYLHQVEILHTKENMVYYTIVRRKAA